MVIRQERMLRSKRQIAGLGLSARLTKNTHKFHTRHMFVKTQDIPSDAAAREELELSDAHSSEEWRIQSRIAQAGVAF